MPNGLGCGGAPSNKSATPVWRRISGILAKDAESYSLRLELFVSKMDVSRTKIRLDTSISATSNSERREYLFYNLIKKTTLTCPFGTYAYRCMPFGLCNAPATFQRCMTAIFSDFCEKIVEVFMDDFFVYGTSFDDCLSNLD